MAAAIIFDGGNDYLKTINPVGNDSGTANDNNQHWDFSFILDLLEPSTYVYRVIDSTVYASHQILFRRSDGLVRFVSPVSGNFQWSGIAIPSGTEVKFTFEKPLGSRSMNLYINDTFISNDTGGDNLCGFDIFGMNGNTGWISGKLYLIVFNDYVNTENSANYDPAASNNGVGTPILVDTLGGNDATGVGFPTNGSAWHVDENIESYDFSATINIAAELNGSLSKTVNKLSVVNQTSQLSSNFLKNTDCLATINQPSELNSLFSKIVNVDATLEQSVLLYAHSTSAVLEIHEFSSVISVTTQHSATFNKVNVLGSEITQTIEYSADVNKSVELESSINQQQNLVSQISKNCNFNSSINQQIELNASFFNSIQPVYLHRFRLDGSIVFQRFDGVITKQRFNGVIC